MLTSQTYRAAVLHTYRQQRSQGATPRAAFMYARCTVKPLPWTPEDRALADAARSYPRARLALDNKPRTAWKLAYGWARWVAQETA